MHFNKTSCAIYWIMIYPLDNIVHPLNNQAVSFMSLFLSHRWATLKAALVERRSKLGESKTIQQFSRDAEDIEAWVSEKLQTVLDESYKDPTNLQVTKRFFF